MNMCLLACLFIFLMQHKLKQVEDIIVKQKKIEKLKYCILFDN